MDAEEYQLQLKGLAAAIGSPDVTSSILIPCTKILNIEILESLSSKLRHTQRQYAPSNTALGKAIQTGVSYLNQQPSCWKRTLDISGDGKSNTGPAPYAANLLEKIEGIVINALVIGADPTKRLSHEELSVDELATYFSNHVLAGPRAFVEVAANFANYERAMSRKLLRELQFFGLSFLNQ